MSARLAPPLTLTVDTSRLSPELLARLGVFGGAVYDAIVALAAQENGRVLATRDTRARVTYERVGVAVELVA